MTSKFYHLFFITLFTCVALAGIHPANAQSVGEAHLLSACSPWKGDAMQLVYNLPTPGRKLEISIWGAGLTSFYAGKAFTIDNVSDGRGTGRARIVEEKRVVGNGLQFTSVTPRIEPPARGGFLAKGGKWTVSFPSPADPDNVMIYSISPIISMLQPVCGKKSS
jgi:hypothetical protein